MKKLLQNFSKSNDGAVALIIGIALVFVLFGILSLTVDLNRAQVSYSKGQDATDAAALGTSEFVLKGILLNYNAPGTVDPFAWKPTQAELDAYAENIIKQNFQTAQTSAIYDPSSLVVEYVRRPAAGGVGFDFVTRVSACANLNTDISEAARHDDELRTCTTSEAAFSLASNKKVEVAFALDYTYSMYCPPGTSCDTNPALANSYAATKANSLVNTMNYILDSYFTGPGSNNIYGSIVPFSALTNLYPYNSRMISPQSTPPSTLQTEANTIKYNTQNVRDYGTAPDFRTAGFAYYVNYGRPFSYVLNRIPAISAAKFNSFIAAGSNPANVLPVGPFHNVIDNISQLNNAASAETMVYRDGYCYNYAVLAGLDQRIEKEVRLGGERAQYVDSTGATADGILANGEVQPNQTVAKYRKSGDAYPPYKTLRQLNGITGPYVELHESFTVQPLTNKKEVLQKAVERFAANGVGQSLYNATYPAFTVIDHTNSRLNKSFHYTQPFGTSSVNGLLWSWLTINNNLDGDWWRQASVTEKYLGGTIESESVASRADLPSDDNLKYIILLTDGTDNDGADAGTASMRQCDSYVPHATLTDNQYNNLCTRIKNDNVKVYTILYDFNPPAGTNRYQNCASTGGYYANVTPDQLQNVMDTIFKDIISDLVTVRLID